MENRIFLVIPIIISLVLLPFAGFGQEGMSGSPPQPAEDQRNVSIPPVEQPLMPEGVFAVQLAQALKMGKVKDEVQAESMLSAVGIEPKNGWIADYPVTPDIVAEIKTSVAAAAEANKIGMGKDEAQKAVAGLEADLGLNIRAGSPPTATGEVQEAAAPAEVVNNYYYDYGPPVVTYYPPPWDYDYLYAWVPFPFCWGDFFFGGFFVLHDFHRHIHFHHHEFVISNHVVNVTTNRVLVVDPVSRSVMTNRLASTRAFSSPKIQTSARTIVSRSWNRVPSGGVPTGSRMGSVAPSTSLNRTAGQIRTNQSTLGQRETQPMNNFRPPQVSRGRTFSPPAVSERSFSATPPRVSSPPPVSQGHVFSAHAFSSRGFSGGFHGGGGSFRGFHGGGGGHR